MRCTAARIARLHREVGTVLDDVGAPLRCLTFVAYATDEVVVRTNQVQQTRFDAMMAFHSEHGKWPLPWQISVLRINGWERLHGCKADPHPEPEEPENTASAKSAESSQDGSAAAALALKVAIGLALVVPVPLVGVFFLGGVGARAGYAAPRPGAAAVVPAPRRPSLGRGTTTTRTGAAAIAGRAARSRRAAPPCSRRCPRCSDPSAAPAPRHVKADTPTASDAGELDGDRVEP